MGLAAREDDLPRGERSDTVELMGREEHSATVAGCVRELLVEHSPAFGVEPGMRFVEQQEPRVASEGNREREAPPLPGREASVPHVGEARQPDPVERLACSVCRRPGGAGRECRVLEDGEIVVARGVVTDEGELAPVRSPVGAQVMAEHFGFAGVERHETGDEAEQRRLPGAVPAGEEEHLTGRDVEIHARERREPAQQTHGRPEADDGLHNVRECTDRLLGRANRPEGRGRSEPVTRLRRSRDGPP